MPVQPRSIHRMREDARAIFNSGLQAVEPGAAIKRYCRVEADQLIVDRQTYDLRGYRRIVIIGAGKATAPMAAAIESLLADRISDGLINVKYGHVARLQHIHLVEAGHPVPDQNGQEGARRMLRLAQMAGSQDLVICLISGGGSALLPLPADGLHFEDKQTTIKVLIACGATIHEINAIRKHISAIKGGRLALAAYPATLISLILSDVVGDDLDVIASGPTVADSSTFQDCLKIIERHRIETQLPTSILRHLQAGAAGEIAETPTADDPAFRKTQNLVVASNIEAILASRQKAEELGYQTLVLSSMIEGDTRTVARVHGAIAREIVKTGNPVSPPACILSGGETTVQVTGSGLGGRNQEFALAAALDIAGCRDIVLLSGGTDGTDGPTDAAGAIADTGTIQRAAKMDLDTERYLTDNDSYHFFEKIEDLLITGPTNTNVMDLRIVLVDQVPEPARTAG
jgi:glycerate 2-kinase